MIETAINDYLLSYKGLTALVSNKIYPVVIPSANYPSVSFVKVAAMDELMMGDEDGIMECKIQFDCWGSSFASAKAVAVQVVKALKHYTGMMGDTMIHCTHLVNEIDSLESKVYRTMLEFEFQYEP